MFIIVCLLRLICLLPLLSCLLPHLGGSMPSLAQEMGSDMLQIIKRSSYVSVSPVFAWFVMQDGYVSGNGSVACILIPSQHTQFCFAGG